MIGSGGPHVLADGQHLGAAVEKMSVGGDDNFGAVLTVW